MKTQDFNLVSDPWIKVFNLESEDEELVSLKELFKNTTKYYQIAGEMRSQDLSILRFLLAILTTVYTRYDSNDHKYDWLNNNYHLESASDFDKKDLFKTWEDLYKNKSFSQALFDYLEKYSSKFKVFSEDSFLLVSESTYDKWVMPGRTISTGSGVVAVKQINRTISESNNRPAIFSSKSPMQKNKVSIDELVRWLITYENITGTTDKVKLNIKEKLPNSRGWVYGLNPIYFKGDNLFETMLYNLVLIGDTGYAYQKPIWEFESYDDYLEERIKCILPDNIAGLYTLESRMLHIEWDKKQNPTIYAAGIPKVDNTNAFIEPMTIWRYKKKEEVFKPALRISSANAQALWRGFGNFVDAHEVNNIVPGIITWMRNLKEHDCLSKSKILQLSSVEMISDGNAASQLPAAEVSDDMLIESDVLFDNNPNLAERWNNRISELVNLTQVIGKDIWVFSKNIGDLNGYDISTEITKLFYDKLNDPFKQWLSDLVITDDLTEKSEEWKQILSEIATQVAQHVFNEASTSLIMGKNNQNIFTLYNKFNYNLSQHLNRKDN